MKATMTAVSGPAGALTLLSGFEATPWGGLVAVVTCLAVLAWVVSRWAVPGYVEISSQRATRADQQLEREGRRSQLDHACRLRELEVRRAEIRFDRELTGVALDGIRRAQVPADSPATPLAAPSWPPITMIQPPSGATLPGPGDKEGR